MACLFLSPAPDPVSHDTVLRDPKTSFLIFQIDVFRAVAPIAGAQLSGCSGGTTPVAYLGIHGVVDSVLPVDSGRQLRDRFLGLNGCAAQEAPEPAAGTGSHIKTEYQCTGPPVWWIAHSGDHVADPRDGDGTLWAPGETWDFFTNVA